MGKNTIIKGSAIATVDFEAESKLEKIGVSAFSKCINIKSITLPNNLMVISTGAFDWSSISNITWGSKLHLVGKNAFNNSRQIHVVILPSAIMELRGKVLSGKVELLTVLLSQP